MKVLALVPEAFHGFGGIAQYNRDLISALSQSDKVSRVHVLPRLAKAPREALPPKVTQAEPIFARSLYAMHVCREALRFRPDLIFCGHLYAAPLARYVGKLARAPFVLQLHGSEIWRRASSAQTGALEQADAVLCVSRHTREQTLKFSRANPSRVVVVPNTVGSDYRPGDREVARRNLGLGDEFALLTVGRLDPREGYKGHDCIIDALANIPDTTGPLTYLISGKGEDRSRLEALADRRGIAGRIRFLGFTPRPELPDLYRAADLFVMPSRGEGFGIVFLEAMASGTPALGLEVGGALDPLTFSDWGRAVTLVEFPAALEQMMALPRPDPEEMHEAINKRFGFDVFAEQVVDQLVGRFSAAAPRH